MMLTSLHFLSVAFSSEDITHRTAYSAMREREGEAEKRDREETMDECGGPSTWVRSYGVKIVVTALIFFYLYSYRNIYYMWGEMLTNHKLLLC